ncbi:hypothetical protein HPB51_017537 [Rhipicephalus microplus]|uniref:Tnf receptor-associated factor n=1 Tax=Rhipicephalus microplus TaxID=6941 RepID=A0A9J6EAW2_RHIMP|nr:hypothetical protein HPB51_017537 [Rhipicephalus microplus]
MCPENEVHWMEFPAENIMKRKIYPHAVFGFCEILDWTTLHFVKPIDDIRVCSACRAVSRKTAFLACRHVLCQPCFESWKSTRSNTCVIDGDLCPEKEVYWMEFPAEKMMKSEVSCWNWDNGCQIVTDVSSITNHFHQDCEHHSTCCPKCSSTVLRKDVIAHLESGCANHVLRIRSTTPPNDVESNDLESIREDVRYTESAFRNACHNDASLVTSVEGIAANIEENAESLSTVAVEVVHISRMTEQTLSGVARSSKVHVNQIADVKAYKECLSADLDEIKRNIDEFRHCASAEKQEMTEHDENAKKLLLLKMAMQSVSCMLRYVTIKVHASTAVAQYLVADGLREALSCYVSSIRQTQPSGQKFPLNATARIFENELKVPVKGSCVVRVGVVSAQSRDYINGPLLRPYRCHC